MLVVYSRDEKDNCLCSIMSSVQRLRVRRARSLQDLQTCISWSGADSGWCLGISPSSLSLKSSDPVGMQNWKTNTSSSCICKTRLAASQRWIRWLGEVGVTVVMVVRGQWREAGWALDCTRYHTVCRGHVTLPAIVPISVNRVKSPTATYSL